MLTQWFDKSFVLTTGTGYRDRIDTTMAHLRAEGIEAEKFIGLDGKTTGINTIHTYELDNPGSNYRIAPKLVNMWLGHFIMWKVCDYVPGDSFLFMEDDVRFVKGWKDQWNLDRPKLPDDWDLLFIGSCCCMDKRIQKISGHLHKINYALCTHAYAVRKKALPVMLSCADKVYASIDITIALHAIPKLNTYAFLPRLADQHETNISP